MNSKRDALKKAQYIDNNFDDFKALPLGGVPIAHKDIFCTEGRATTCGSNVRKICAPL